MKSKFFILGLAIIAQIPLSALLPPYYESIKEYQALLSSKELEQKLGSGQAIESITRNEQGFILLTPKYELQVDVRYQDQKMPGPANFYFEFHPPELRR